MANSTHTQPSPVARQPVSPPHYGEEPGSRIAQDAVPYQGPSQRNYKGRVRLLFTFLGAILLTAIILTIRVLTDGGL
jgi:hypothetical protein